MCDCESPSAYQQYTRHARRGHACWECGETIPPGAEYEYASGVWAGRGASYKTCLRCVGVREWYVAECMPQYACRPCFGELWQDATDNGHAGTVAELTRAAAAAGYL